MEGLILHIPHASRHIPSEERTLLLPDEAGLQLELLCMTDAWTDLLLDGIPASVPRITCPVSRLVVDVERFPDDAEEPMAARGMGAVYFRLSTGEPLRRENTAHREALMRRWYQPHHATLQEAVDAAMARHGRCLIIDMHSFNSAPLPHEPDQAPDRPELCLGFDAFHAPLDEAEAMALCAELGFAGAVNRPFAGSIVPAAHWQRTAAVQSVMIEVRRDLYMDEASGERLPSFAAMAERMAALTRRLHASAAKRGLG